MNRIYTAFKYMNRFLKWIINKYIPVIFFLSIATITSCGGSLFESITKLSNKDLVPTAITDFQVSTVSGTYHTGDSIAFTITFNENIALSAGGTLDVTLDTGEVVHIPASQISGNTAAGTYIIGAGVSGTNPLSITAVNITNGVITDADGNPITGAQLSANSSGKLPMNSSSSSNITIDAVTQPPVIISPAASTSDNSTVAVSYTIPETALDGSVNLIFTRTGGTADANAPHIVTMSSTASTVGSHVFNLNGNDLSSTAEVASVSSGTNDTLVHGAIYSVRLEYQDQYANPVGYIENLNFTYDLTTVAPILILPAASTSDNSLLNVSYTIPEAAFDGTVKLLFTSTGGTADGGSPHTITMTSEAGQAFVLNGADIVGTSGVASATGGNSLVDGAIYDVVVQYQDSSGNSLASDTNVSFKYDISTAAPILTVPASSNVYDRNFNISYTLPETALAGSVKLIFTYNSGTADGDHTLVMSSVISQSTTIDATDLAGDPVNYNVESGGLSLVDGAIYNVTLEYQDYLGNPKSSVQNTLITYSNDHTTETPTLLTPASNAVDDSSFNISYTIPEPAKDGTVKLIFTRVGGSADTTHTVTMISEASQAFVLNGANLFVTTEVATVAGGNSLVHNAIYDVRLQYQDIIGNPAAYTDNFSIKYDNSTDDPILINPGDSTKGNGTFNVQYTIPETAQNGTVKLIFSGNDADPTPHVLRMMSEASDSFTLDATALLANNASKVEALESGSSSLVNGAVYSVRIEYQDSLGHPVAFDTHTNFTYDLTTQNPVLNTPAASSSVNGNISMNYDLPEAAKTGTVKLYFLRTGGAADTDHTLTMASETSGNHTFLLNPVNLSSNATEVASVSGGNSLVDQAIYTVKIEYQDVLGNPVVSDQHTGFMYDVTTLTPTITTPAASTTALNNFNVSYTLPETAKDVTVKLIFTQTGGTADAGSPHTLTIVDESVTSYTINAADLIAVPAQYSHSGGTSSLVNGAIYTIRLEYQDLLSNTMAYDENLSVTYDGGTIAPTLTLPAHNSKDNASLAVSYNLPETANAGSVKLTFAHVSGSADGNAPHIVTMSSNTSGAHAFNLNGADLSNSAEVTSVSSGTNDLLVNGAVYDVTIEYADTNTHGSVASGANRFTYDTVTDAPTFDYPAGSTGYNDPMALKYTIPEAALNASVKLTFTWAIGNADAGSPHVITMVSEATQDTTIMVSNFSGDSKIESYTGGNSLVNGATYNVTLQYQDSSGNTAASVLHNGVNFGDISTQTPILTTPAVNSFDNSSIAVNYSIETALNDSVKLIFTRESGSLDADSPHTITMTSESSQSFSLNGANLSGTAGVQGVTGGNSLVDGTVYTVKLEYRDQVPNPLAFVENTGFTYDTTAPTLSSVHIQSSNGVITRAKTGDTVTLSFDSSENLIANPTVTIRGSSAGIGGGPTLWTATYVMQGTDTEGLVPFTINFTDRAGNAGTQVTTTNDASSVTFDRTVPTLNYVHIVSSNGTITRAKTGDTITLSFTSPEDLTTKPTVTIAGNPIGAGFVTMVGNATSWYATYVMQAGDTEGNVTFSINFTDLAGNPGTAVTAVTDSSYVTFDRSVPNAPTGLVLASADDTGILNSDQITSQSSLLTVSGSAEANATVKLYDGITLLGTTTASGGGSWSWDIALSAGTTNVTATATDDAGNVSSASSALPITVDTAGPSISLSSLASNNRYIDISFNEGIYHSDYTRLLSTDLYMNFVKGGSGVATGVTISSVKKADSTDEGTASNISAGDTVARVFLTVTGTPNGNETIEIYLKNASSQLVSVYDNAGNASVTTSSTGVISLNPVSIVQFSSTSSSGSEGTSPALIQITLNPVAPGGGLTINYSFTGTGSYPATGGGVDYTDSTISVFVDAGNGTANISVPIAVDSLYEYNEQFKVILGNGTGYAIGTNSEHSYTINDDDSVPTVGFTSASQSSANETSGSTMTITAQLSAASGRNTTVPISIGGGTAIQDTDYTLSSNTISIPAGSLTGTATLTIIGDTLNEANETIIVNMGTPTNATASGITTHTATITDDDVAPTVSINNVSQNEGNSGTSNFTFTVTLSAVSGQTASLTYNTANGTATTADNDYVAIVNQTLTFNPGETVKNINVTVNGDTTASEGNQTFTVVLSGLTNITDAGSTKTGTGTILDDDLATPNITFASASSSGNENIGIATFNLNITPALAAGSITLNYTIAGTGGSTAGVDFDNSTTTLVINAGETTKSISVPIVNDTLDEIDESFTITLQDNGVQYTHTGQDTHVFTIIDNDAAPQVDFTVSTSATSNESTPLAITVTLSALSGKSVTVIMDDSTLGTAEPEDYSISPTTGNTVTINPGSLTGTITLTPVNDGLPEGSETVVLKLRSPTNATLGAITTHTATITDDDSQAQLSVSDLTRLEGQAFTMKINCIQSASCSTVSVNYATSDGTATTSGGDYTAKSGSVTGGMWLGTAPNFYYDVSLTVADDSMAEPAETFLFTLSGAVNGLIIDPTATVTINDNDAPLTITKIETLDCQGGSNGIIDHVRITFSDTVTDSKVDGYVSNVVKGDPVTTWQVSGHTNVRFDPPGAIDSNCTAGFGADGINDAVIYFKFDEQLSANTGVIPDVTAVASTVESATGKGKLYYNTGNVSSTDIVETDSAGPYIWSAVASDTGSNNNTGKAGANDTLTVYFSESMTPMNLSSIDLDLILKLNNSHVFGDRTADILSTTWTAFADPNDTLVIVFKTGATTVIPGDTIYAAGSLADANSNSPGTNIISMPAIGGAFDSGELGPVIISAEYLDTNNNGRLDHVRLTFNMNIDDTTIDGYINGSTEGNVTTNWRIAGYTNVRFDPIDGANNNVVNFKFSEGLAYDTGAKPDLTAIGSTIKDNVGSKFCKIGESLSSCEATPGASGGTINSIDVIERDSARPVFISATARVDDRYVFVFFSENVWSAAGTPACGSGGELIQDSGSSTLDFDYASTNGGVSSIESVDGLENCAATDGFVRLFANNVFIAGDMNSDVLKPSSGSAIFDAEGNAMDPNHSIKVQQTIAPYVIGASSFYDSTGVYGPTGTSWLRIVYSEPMHYERSVNAGNYTLTVDKPGTCTTINANPISVRSISTTVFDLQTNAQCGDTIYKIKVSKNILDLNEIEPIGSPDVATSYGTGSTDTTAPRLLQALSMDSNRIRITYSEPMKTGNVTGSAECAGGGFPATCVTDIDAVANVQNLYTITPSLGVITSVLQTSDPSIFDIIHATPQTGSFYTVSAYASNNVTYIPEDLSSLNLASIPNNQATFRGQGQVIQIISDGPLFSDPFADGSSFSFAFNFGGRVYLGPNDVNSGAYRFEPDGSNPLSITFLLVDGTTTDFDFGTASSPNFKSEIGVSFFQSGIMKAQPSNVDTEFMIVTPLQSPKLNDIWFTTDIDAQLDFSRCSLGTSSGMIGAETVRTIGKYLYVGVLTTSPCSKKPVLRRFTLNTSTSPYTCAEDGNNWDSNTQKIPGIGDGAGNTAAIIGIDFFFNDGATLYLGNNGGVAYATINDTTGFPKTDADFTSIINETINQTACTNNSPTDWCTGGVRTLALNSTEKIPPGRKGLPFMIKYYDGSNTALLLARNVTSTLGGITRVGSELWKCSTATDCKLKANWSRVFKTGASGTGIEINNNVAISMLDFSGTKLFVGFDNINDGARVYQASVVPTDKTSFTEVGRVTTSNCDHTGDTGSLGGFCWGFQILSSAKEQKQGHNYLYLTTGCRENTDPNSYCDFNKSNGAVFDAPPIRVLTQID